MKFNSKNSFKSLDVISSLGKEYKIFNLKNAEKNGLEGISKLPKSLKVLLGNLLRHEDETTVKSELPISEIITLPNEPVESTLPLISVPEPLRTV